MSKVGIGVIGLGHIASRAHFPGYLEIPDSARVVALCDTNPDNISNILRLCKAKAYDDYSALLKDPAVEAVDICLPHNLHGRVALAALRAGKHVIVEKPIATSLDEAQKIISTAKENKVKLMVAENTRFVKAYEVTKELLDQNGIGQIALVRTLISGSEVHRLSNSTQWIGKSSESGGGVVFDSGVHSFYLLEWMVGRIKSMIASTTRFLQDLPTDVEDNASGTVRFASGAIGNFALSNTTESPWTERLELHGINGSLIVDMLSEHPVQLFSTKNKSNDPKSWWGRYGDVSWQEPFFPHSAMNWKTDSIKKEVQHFVNCIIQDKPPLVSGEDGKRAIEIALKAYESAKLGREVEVT